MKNKVIAAVIFLMFFVSVTAIVSLPAAAAEEEYIFVSCLGNIEYFNAHKYGWKRAGEVLGVKTTYMGPPDFDLAAMAATMDQAIVKQPKGIVMFGVDPSLDPSINKAVDAGIPVAVVIGDQPNSKRLTYVGSYQEDLGYLGGKKIAEAIGGKGKVAILTIPGFEQWDSREKGFRKAFGEYPGIEVVAKGDTKADTVIAIKAGKDILTRFPDLAAFAGCDSTAAIGAATAVEEADLAGKVAVVGVDRNSDVLAKIRKGTITGTVAQDDAAMSFWALLTLYYYNHYRPPLTSDIEKSGAKVEPTLIYTPANYVDKTNLEFYLEANKLYTDF